MADYTWLELLRRLGLEARPQIGYFNIPRTVQDMYPNGDVPTMVGKNRPIVPSDKIKEWGKVGFPNRDLMINSAGGYNKQSEYFKQILNRLNPLTKNFTTPKQVVDFLEKQGMAGIRDIGGIIEQVGAPNNPELFHVNTKNFSAPRSFKFPTQTLGMMGEKIIATPGVKPTLNFLGRASIPLAIYEGLNSPLSDEQEVMNNYNAVRGLPLQGGIKYYGE